jgi:hypothetical protein
MDIVMARADCFQVLDEMRPTWVTAILKRTDSDAKLHKTAALPGLGHEDLEALVIEAVDWDLKVLEPRSFHGILLV